MSQYVTSVIADVQEWHSISRARAMYAELLKLVQSTPNDEEKIRERMVQFLDCLNDRPLDHIVSRDDVNDLKTQLDQFDHDGTIPTKLPPLQIKKGFSC